MDTRRRLGRVLTHTLEKLLTMPPTTLCRGASESLMALRGGSCNADGGILRVVVPLARQHSQARLGTRSGRAWLGMPQDGHGRACTRILRCTPFFKTLRFSIGWKLTGMVANVVQIARGPTKRGHSSVSTHGAVRFLRFCWSTRETFGATPNHKIIEKYVNTRR